MGQEKIFNEEVEKILLGGGWLPEISVEDDIIKHWETELEKSDSLILFPKARDALRKFGNLKIVQSGSGVDYARETFEINPLLLWGESERMLEIKDKTGLNAYPLGEAGNRHVFLAITEDGKVYIINSHIELVGDDVYNALENLILGKKP